MVTMAKQAHSISLMLKPVPLAEHPSSNVKLEGVTLDQLHDNISGADVVQRANARMIQGLNCPCLAFDAGAELFRQNLDGHRAVEPHIPRLIDLAHATSANGRKDFVRAELLACRQRHTSGPNQFTRSRSRQVLDLRPTRKLSPQVRLWEVFA